MLAVVGKGMLRLGLFLVLFLSCLWAAAGLSSWFSEEHTLAFTRSNDGLMFLMVALCASLALFALGTYIASMIKKPS